MSGNFRLGISTATLLQLVADLSRDPRFGSDPAYYVDVIEPAMLNAESAVELVGL